MTDISEDVKKLNVITTNLSEIMDKIDTFHNVPVLKGVEVIDIKQEAICIKSLLTILLILSVIHILLELF